jgi:site-specific recombinase XerD
MTVADYLRRVRPFLEWRFGRGPIVARSLRPSDASRFIALYAKTAGSVDAKHVVVAVRALFRFFFVRGLTRRNLVPSVPTVPHWPSDPVPRWIPEEQVEQIVRSCDGRTPKALRDRAMVLLLARLGLRPAELLSITLDDIDWDSGVLTVRGKKSARVERLPLPSDVGRSIALYVRRARPRLATRSIFITTSAPVRELRSTGAVYKVVANAVRRAGLDPPHRGAYLLRHSLATTMLGRGSSLREIGEILRHQRADTTARYAKVDFASLRALALPWPGSD